MFSAYFSDYVSGKKAEPMRSIPAGAIWGEACDMFAKKTLGSVPYDTTSGFYGGFVSKSQIQSLISESKQMKKDFEENTKEEE